MFKVNVARQADALLGELEARGLVVKLERFDEKLGARHWHLGYPKRPGTLEVTDFGDVCELRVASRRDGGWAEALANELASS
ncbi:MAG TPA: hypothetical protein VFZ17_14675 [Acidimicrobiia bacterium]|nr:hypothetical protein [Acidimicrobiia bacterium]